MFFFPKIKDYFQFFSCNIVKQSVVHWLIEYPELLSISIDIKITISVIIKSIVLLKMSFSALCVKKEVTMETRHFLFVLTILFFHIHIFPIPGTPKNKTKQDVTCSTAGWGLPLKYACGHWSIPCRTKFKRN